MSGLSIWMGFQEPPIYGPTNKPEKWDTRNHLSRGLIGHPKPVGRPSVREVISYGFVLSIWAPTLSGAIRVAGGSLSLSLSLSLRPRLVRVLSDVLNETVYLAEQATVGADATN